MSGYYLLVILLAATNTCSNILIKIGANKVDGINFKLLTNWFLIIGLTLFGLGFILWVFILNKVQLSIAAPIMSLAYVFIMIASYLLFKEPITGVKVIGVILILFGVVFITK
jgi:drug/metabolite transporter (DMT)-like permease